MQKAGIALLILILTAVLSAVGIHASNGGNAKIVHIQEHVTNATYVPVSTLVGSDGPFTQGDYVAFDDPDFDPETGQQVGHNMGVCTLVDVATQIYTCSEVTFYLAGRGQISIGGMFDGTGNPTSGAILVGTGEFLGARGTVRVQALNGGTVDDFVFTLSK